ncbi:hypothetical protein LCGC14_1817440, partial [marine sediment metagenome]
MSLQDRQNNPDLWQNLGTMRHDPEQYQFEKIIGKRNKAGVPFLRKLRVVHRRMIALHLRGFSNRDIQVMTGHSEMSVGRVLRDPLSQVIIQQYMDGIELELDALMPDAVDALRRGLNSEEARVAIVAADKFFRATGRYARSEDKTETAEDVISRALKIAERATGAIQNLTTPDPIAKLIEVSPVRVDLDEET